MPDCGCKCAHEAFAERFRAALARILDRPPAPAVRRPILAAGVFKCSTDLRGPAQFVDASIGVCGACDTGGWLGNISRCPGTTAADIRRHRGRRTLASNLVLAVPAVGYAGATPDRYCPGRYVLCGVANGPSGRLARGNLIHETHNLELVERRQFDPCRPLSGR